MIAIIIKYNFLYIKIGGNIMNLNIVSIGRTFQAFRAKNPEKVRKITAFVERIFGLDVPAAKIAGPIADEFVITPQKMLKQSDLSEIVERYVSHFNEPRYTKYKVFPEGTKIQTPQGIRALKKGEVVIVERGSKGETYLNIENAKDIIEHRGVAVYSRDGKLEQIIEKSKKEQLENVENQLKQKGIEYVGIEDTDANFIGENILVKINGKLHKIDPNGIGHPRNDDGLSVKKMLLNTIEKYGHLKPGEINYEKLAYSLDMNPYFLKAFLNAKG